MARVLHIIENFNGQAIEKWLYQVLHCLTEEGVRTEWSFYSILGRPGRYDEEVRRLGARLIYASHGIDSKLAFLNDLRRVMGCGGYDVLHCHHDVMSAVYLMASAGLPLRKRIVHVHNTALSLPTSSRLKTALLHEPMRRVCLYGADRIVGVSRDALGAFLVDRKSRPGRDVIVHCGFDTKPFQKTSHGAIAHSLGLPEDSKILLFVGRMIEYKNPCFLIDVMDRLPSNLSNVCAVFAGTGPLEAEVLRLAERKSLGGRVRVLGWRDDIPAIMQSCDLLVWPVLEQPREGLGLGVVEAQAAGLPVLMSRGVPEEAIVIPELVNILSLADGPQGWADAVATVLSRMRPDRRKSLERVEASSFSISHSASGIMALYRD